MIRKYIIIADDSIKGFDEEIARLEREWGAEEIEPCEDAVSRENALNGLIATDLKGWQLAIALESIEKLPSVTPKTQWIPVSEKLPEEGEPILFSTKTGRVYEGAYFDLIDNRQWYAYKDENYAWNNVVTAWMPLPQPYRESEDKE